MTIADIQLKLQSNKSADRRSAAKTIGKLCIKQLGETLLQSFIKEKKDSRTWETKVEMILSLGLIDYKKAIPEVEIIIEKNLSYDMITYTAAKTYVRLMRTSINDALPVIKLLKSGGLSLVSGALNPLGNDKMMPPCDEINKLISLSWDLHQHKDRIGNENGYLDPRYGLALACAGWDKKLTAPFLNHCLNTAGSDNILKEVAASALRGKYGKSR